MALGYRAVHVVLTGFDRTYEGLKPIHALLLALHGAGFDRTYEGLKPSAKMASGWWP